MDTHVVSHGQTKGILSGQTALITDGGSETGAAIALAMAEAGATVAINSSPGDPAAEQLANDIRAMDKKAFSLQARVDSEPQVRQMFAQVVDTAGDLDILVNNAARRNNVAFHAMTLSDWQTVIDINLSGQFLCAREAVRRFRSRCPARHHASAAGKIIHVSPVHDPLSTTANSVWSAAAGGARILMQNLARELAAYRIRVNSIAPGAIKTVIDHVSPAVRARLLERVPYGRLGETDDVANAAVWLASDLSDYVTGATLHVDGGMRL